VTAPGYPDAVSQKYGIDVQSMSPHGVAAVQAAERLSARTIIYREQVPLAAIVPFADIDKLDPRDPGEDGSDPLLSLSGTCSNDAFVDAMNADMSRTVLFRR
jgi:hypothetical protein